MSGAGLAQNREANHSLEPSTWSLQFQISNNFTLSSFQGSVISAKYHFSRQRAIRFGLALSGTFQDRKQTNQEFTDDNMGVENTSDDHSDSQNIDLITQYIFYSTPKRMNFYGGIGPIVGFFRNSRDSKDDNQDPDIMDTTTRWAVGLNAIIGGEWFAAKNISLLAEYGVLAEYEWVSSTRTAVFQNRRDVFASDLKQLTLSGQSVRFGVSLYF